MKKQTTHTPGPWIYREDRLEVEADGRTVADIRCSYIADECVEPNARLIAAAPELLAALYEALPIVEDAKEDPCYKPGYTSKIERALRAAIAKAEGR